MTKEEILKALNEGHKVTHICFTEDEWIKKHNSTQYIFEDDVICDIDLFWADRTGIGFNTGWAIWEPI